MKEEEKGFPWSKCGRGMEIFKFIKILILINKLIF
jgi:hypothetical protein